METADLDRLRSAYKDAVEAWIARIRAEESYATPDHSMKEWNEWEQAGMKEEEARERAKAARREYEDALREALYGF